MTASSSAPARQTARELPEQTIRAPSALPPAPQAGETPIACLRLLWESRGWLARVTAGGLLASALAALLIPARYESTARLMPPDSGPSGSSLAMAAAAMAENSGGLGGLAGELLGLKGNSDTLVGILSSRTVQDRLIEEFDLKKRYGNRRMEDARRSLEAHTRISVDRKSQITSIAVTDGNPQRAQAMSQAYVEELNRLVAALSTSSARRERIFLEQRLQAVSRELEAAERDSSEFASRNTAIDIKEQAKAMVDSAALLQGQIIAATSELEGLRQMYTDGNVRVREVRARIGELQRQLEKLGGKDEHSSGPSDSPADALYPSIRTLPLLGVTYADLYRRTMVQEAVFETLTKEYELAKVQEAKETPQIKVLDAANLPESKSFPPRLAIVFWGTAFVGVSGAGWVLLRALWRDTDARDPRKMLVGEVCAAVAACWPPLGSRARSGQVAGKSFWSRWPARPAGSAGPDPGA